MTCHQAALAYLEMGLHPIPCAPRSKRPLVKWQQYQTTAPTREDIDLWWAKEPDANVALVLGRGMFAVDLDGGADAERLLVEAGITLPPDAPRSRTASGFHVFLSSYNPVPDRVGLLTSENGHHAQVDIRGVGIVVAAPSIHPTGVPYEWDRPLDGTRPPAAPDGLLALIAQSGVSSSASAPRGRQTGTIVVGSWMLEALSGVEEGKRDATATKLAGFLLGKGLDADLTTTFLSATFARNCRPPFPEADLRKCVDSIARREGVAGHNPVAVAHHIDRVLQGFLRVIEEGAPPTVPTPFPLLNHKLNGGWSPGELIYLGARPGVGKTALGLHCARVAAKAGKGVLIVSREMTTVSLVRRMIAQEGRINASALKRADLNDLQLHELGLAVTRLSNLPIWLTDQVVTFEQLNVLMSEASRFGLVIVDYLQLLRAPAGIRERRHQVEHVSAGLKTLALEYRVPILCLSSLSRPADRDKPKQPGLADLRESGELEHDADVILMLHRPDANEPEVTCLIQKNREGEVGGVPLHFHAEFVSFSQIDTRL